MSWDRLRRGTDGKQSLAMTSQSLDPRSGMMMDDIRKVSKTSRQEENMSSLSIV